MNLFKKFYDGSHVSFFGGDESFKEPPYIEKTEVITHYLYNPNYGDNRICECGHSYYRHFDSWEQMDNVGCKYCRCDHFSEKK